MIRCCLDGRDQVCGPFELVALGVQVQGSEAYDDVPDAGGDVLAQSLAHLVGGADDNRLARA
ncbi:hypothetical protein [Streptomyces sp. NPDC058683]|uniref:hypothetical protein n=1 Tax=Streptomyces sp. NPDC058683 TaxID=3346597 RepID=UPI0036673E8B